MILYRAKLLLLLQRPDSRLSVDPVFLNTHDHLPLPQCKASTWEDRIECQDESYEDHG